MPDLILGNAFCAHLQYACIFFLLAFNGSALWFYWSYSTLFSRSAGFIVKILSEGVKYYDQGSIHDYWIVGYELVVCVSVCMSIYESKKKDLISFEKKLLIFFLFGVFLITIS